MVKLAEPNATKKQIIRLIKASVGEVWNWRFFIPPKFIPDSDFNIRFDFQIFAAPWQSCYSSEGVGWYDINGTTMALCYAHGGWEYPVHFVVYVEKGGKRLRAYVPTVGNRFDIYCKAALGSHETYFSEEELEKLWPADFLNDNDRVYDWQDYVEAHSNIDDMLKDIGAHIEGATPVVPFNKKHNLFYDAKALDEWIKEQPPHYDNY